MLPNILHLIGTIALLAYGLTSIVAPKHIAPFIAHEIPTPRGVAEFRILGGFFSALSAFALYAQNPQVFMALGVAWLGAAAMRLVALLLDRPKFDAAYISFFVSEILLGIFLIL